MKKQTLMSWSTGKDSAWAYHQLLQQGEHDITGLFCTINKAFQRTAMHGVRVELLKSQAQRLGQPLDIIEIPWPCSNNDYERIMSHYIDSVKQRGIKCFAFGDLFLQDIRDYRTDKLQGTGIEPVFPLWQRPTDKLAREMIDGGLRTTITCIDPAKLDNSFAGRSFDDDFLHDLPDHIDPCGENGEFHSFVHDAPAFDQPINIKVGDVVERDGFVFADVRHAPHLAKK